MMVLCHRSTRWAVMASINEFPPPAVHCLRCFENIRAFSTMATGEGRFFRHSSLTCIQLCAISERNQARKAVALAVVCALNALALFCVNAFDFDFDFRFPCYWCSVRDELRSCISRQLDPAPYL